MKIAIIGSGVSGLTAAYYLSKKHEITIYEKDSRVGGHAHTVLFEENGYKIAVDNGFMVYNPPMYPNFVKMLNELGVESVPTTMTFSVDIPGEVHYRGNFPNGIFADRKMLFNLQYLRFLLEIIRFRKVAKLAIENDLYADKSLKEFLTANKLGEDFASWYLYPMLSAVWSIKDADKAGEFPALATFVFLNNHKLLQSSKQRWRTIKGGSIEYVSKIEKNLRLRNADIILKSKIKSIKRSEEGVCIDVDGKNKTFDFVILATHADITKNLISDITAEESHALSYFNYSSNITVLHKDVRLISKDRRILAAWNYCKIKTVSVFTYCMNILQHIDMKTPVFVSLNPQMEIEKSKTYLSENYEHPIYKNDSLKGQKLVNELQGKRRTFYAGAYLGYGFHEDGVTSAVRVVGMINKLGEADE